MNKKAQETFTFLQFVVRLIFLMIMMFSIIFLVRTYTVDKLNVQEVQAETFKNKILFSPNGISYDDKSLGKIPGIIDPDKINNENLDKLMDYKDSSFIAAKIELFSLLDNKKISSAKFNSGTYDDWLPIAQTGIIGEGSVNIIKKTMLVSFIQNNSKRPGVLAFDILMPGR